MSTKNSIPSRIIFQLSGQSLQQVIEWQQALDLKVMQYQIETNGSTLVVRHKQKDIRPLQPIVELPKPGEAIPWYGDIGDVYSYCFQPEAAGCFLRVVNSAGGRVLWHPDPFPPLELHLLHPVQVEKELSRPRWFGLDWGWWYNWPENQVDELRFEIDQKFCQDLVEWGWDDRRVENYEYQFIPTSVGCEILVRDIATGEEIHLTRDVCW